MPIIWTQGLMQQTPAVQALFRGAQGARRGSVKRRAKKAVRKAAKKAAPRAAKGASRKAAKFAKGSAAAKRHMAKLRAMQKRRR